MRFTAPTSHITTFLVYAKALMAKGHYDVIPRKETLNTLAKYGWTLTSDLIPAVYSLTPRVYMNGPVADINQALRGDIWEFAPYVGTQGGTVQIYMKMKIVSQGGKDIVKIMSFHDPNYPVQYPYP